MRKMSVHSMRTGVLGGEHRAPFYTFLPLQQWLNLWLLESFPQNLSKCKISPDGRTAPFFFLLCQPEGYQRGKCTHCANDTAVPIAPLLGPSINCHGYKEGTWPLFTHPCNFLFSALDPSTNCPWGNKGSWWLTLPFFSALLSCRITHLGCWGRPHKWYF